MSVGLIIRLCAMMLLQYFVWGVWMPFFGPQMEAAGFAPSQVGYVLAMMGFGSVIGPLVLAQVADRYFSGEKVMAVTHLIGGGLLIAMAYAPSFWPVIILFFFYCNLYFATVGLSNVVTFRALGEDGRNQFPRIRLFGTIGWIFAGLLLTAFLRSQGVEAFDSLYQSLRKPELLDAIWLAGLCSMVYGLYCFTLPYTPPVPAKETDPLDKRSAVLETLELLRVRSFSTMVILSGLIGIMLAFYFGCEAFFLIDIGLTDTDVPAYMTIGQMAEIFILALVPISVAKLGTKKTLMIGLAAWGVRFGLSMIGYPRWLMVSTIALHGFCFSIIVVAQMYVDRVAPKDIKNSAQNLLTVVVYGVGTIIGNVLAGYLRQAYQPNWTVIWAVPFVATLVCILGMAIFFHEEQEAAKPSRVEPESALAS